MVNMINYKVFIYMISAIISAYALSGVNFDVFIRKNRVWEARILAVLLSIALGYLIGSFVIDFAQVSHIA